MNDVPLRTETLPNLSAAPRTLLFTTWGTVLYVSIPSGELRHGAVNSGLENAVFVVDPTSKEDPQRGWLMYDSGETLEPIICLAKKILGPPPAPQ